ncbi:MAG: class I SAM-dependent methyltransferase [Gammaproteobacteria bacterium]|nr:class I SAM-dependent methyltransferase [Gammaproteobacteria bacterium]
MGNDRSDQLKSEVKEHWESEVCGTRFAEDEKQDEYFQTIERTRYDAEPYIPGFAKFDTSNGKEVLEIGVGAGTDFIQWIRQHAKPTGIDMTSAAISITRERLNRENVSEDRYTLTQGDAENLQFPDQSFDVVYSHGVLHHTPNTVKALQEVLRVLKPGGEARIMVYGVPCWSGLMLWVRYALLAGKITKSQKQVIFENLESPGTKAYGNSEFSRIMEEIGYKGVKVERELGSGDLLMMPPSEKFQGTLYRIVWALWPRWLIRKFGRPWGTALICHAEK